MNVHLGMTFIVSSPRKIFCELMILFGSPCRRRRLSYDVERPVVSELALVALAGCHHQGIHRASLGGREDRSNLLVLVVARQSTHRVVRIDGCLVSGPS